MKKLIAALILSASFLTLNGAYAADNVYLFADKDYANSFITFQAVNPEDGSLTYLGTLGGGGQDSLHARVNTSQLPYLKGKQRILLTIAMTTANIDNTYCSVQYYNFDAPEVSVMATSPLDGGFFPGNCQQSLQPKA